MSTVIDELIVALKLDPKDFQKGANIVVVQMNNIKNTANNTSKNLQQQGKKGASFFTELQKSALKFFSVMAVGTAAFRGFANLIASGAHLSRLATNLGTTANSLHKWGQAVKQSGGTAAGLESTMRGLSAAMTEQQTTGTSSIAGWLSVLGVSLVDAEGKAKKVEDLMLDIGEGVKNKTGNRADQFNILQSMGIDEGTSNLLLKTRKEAEALIASQPGMSDEAAKKAQDINERWEALVERVRGKVRELAIQHFPAIERAVIAISDAFERMSPFITTMTEGFSELNKITDGWLTNILLALGALKLVKGFIPGAGAASSAAGAVAGSALGASVAAALTLKGDTAPDQQGASDLMAKVHQGDRDAAMQLAKIQLNNQFWRFGKPAGEDEIKKRALDLLNKAGQGQLVSGKVTLNQALGKKSAIDGELKEKLAAAEKANNLPSGILSSIISQETGNNKAYLEDPSKYHYGLNEEGKRIAGHTGKVSTAFGPFGLLESTASKPGYGVEPLKDKSMDEQIRFAAQYLSGRVKYAGSMFAGLSGYGEGAKYANQVLGRLPGGTMSGVAPASNMAQSSPSITIGKIDIQTAATDARGIAKDIRQELIAQANTGMR